MPPLSRVPHRPLPNAPQYGGLETTGGPGLFSPGCRLHRLVLHAALLPPLHRAGVRGRFRRKRGLLGWRLFRRFRSFHGHCRSLLGPLGRHLRPKAHAGARLHCRYPCTHVLRPHHQHPPAHRCANPPRRRLRQRWCGNGPGRLLRPPATAFPW